MADIHYPFVLALTRRKTQKYVFTYKLRRSGFLKEDSMKQLILTVAAAALFLPVFGGSCFAGEEAKWESCEDLDGWGNIRECQERVTAWWDKRLNAAYQKQKKQCPTAECPKKLQEAERAWLKYRDLMENAAVEAAGGREAKQTAIEAGAKTRFLLTKQQARLLEQLASQ